MTKARLSIFCCDKFGDIHTSLSSINEEPNFITTEIPGQNFVGLFYVDK